MIVEMLSPAKIFSLPCPPCTWHHYDASSISLIERSMEQCSANLLWAMTKLTKSMLTSVAHSGPCGCAEKLPSDEVARECGLWNWWAEGKGKKPGTW